MNKIILLLINTLVSLCSIGQDTIRVNDTIVKIISNRSESIPDSLVKDDVEKYYEQSAVSLKSEKVISNEVSSLLKEKSGHKYKAMVGTTILYCIKVDSMGHVTNAKYFRDYLHRNFFNNMIIEYIKQLKFSPGYLIKPDYKTNIATSRLIQIKIL